jgi:choline kinase
MKAIMLAAGRGSRLSGDNPDHPPKSLLQFGGLSLLERHIQVLRAVGIEQLTLVVGYRAHDLRAELARIGAEDFVETVDNPDFYDGTGVSLFCARETLQSGARVLFMDADVLYHPDLIERLVASPNENCFLLDQNFEDSDEPVRLCIKNGRVVEFRKAVDMDCDLVGEWPGFLTVGPQIARTVCGVLERSIKSGDRAAPMEEAIREVAMTAPAHTFRIEDITGLPWIEIDFPEDLVRAEAEILPNLPQH